MKKQKLVIGFVCIFALLIISNITFAQPVPGAPPSTSTPYDLGNFIGDAQSTLRTQGNDFLTAAGTVVSPGTTAVPAAAGELLNAFKPASCGEQWLVLNPSSPFASVAGWIGPSVVVMLIIAFGIAMLYMLAQFLNSPQLSALAKDEAFNTILTILRIVFIIGILTGGELWFHFSSLPVSDPSGVYTLGTGGSTSMMDAAMAISRSMLNDMVTQYSMLLLYNNLLHTIYSSTLWFGVSWRAMFQFNLGPILRPFIDVLSMTLQLLSVGLTEWFVHILTLCLIKKYSWGFLIPLGIILRAVPYTRQAGEALLALTFSLMLFYPFTFILDFETHKIMKYNLADPAQSLNAFVSRSGILSVFGSALVAVFLVGGVFMPFFLMGALDVAYELVRGAVYYIVLMSLLLPVLNIFLTLTVARETARFFRADVNFLSFLKII